MKNHTDLVPPEERCLIPSPTYSALSAYGVGMRVGLWMCSKQAWFRIRIDGGARFESMKMGGVEPAER